MKTFRLFFLVQLILSLFGLSSCMEDIFLEGNGRVETEFRRASGFNEVASSGDFEVTIVPGNKFSVEVTAESNLLPYIETDVVGNTLKIRTRGLYSLRENETIEVFITMPKLAGVSLSGSGLINTGYFTSDDFKIALSGSGDIDTQISTETLKANVSGSGTIYIEGDTFESEMVISGSGRIKSYDLEQNICQAVISGSGDMFVNVSESLDAHISGSGRVYYIGYPVVHTSISGSGGVIDKN